MKESPYLQKQSNLVDHFKNMPLIKDFPEEYIVDVLNLSKIRQFDDEECIIREDDYDRWIYILLSGEVNVFIGNEQIARLSHEGEVFGEMALVDKRPRSASVTAVGETACLALDISTLDLVNAEKRGAYRAIFMQIFAEALSERLRNVNEEVARLREQVRRLGGN